LRFCVDKIAVCNSCNNFWAIFGLLFVTTFWLVLVNSLAINFSCTWQPCLIERTDNVTILVSFQCCRFVDLVTKFVDF